ncbi:MAG: glutamate 5-kinase [Mycobacteriales bacterium]
MSTAEAALRAVVGAADRVVVKVGSSSITSLAGGLDPARLGVLVDALATRRRGGAHVVLVSSGAIAAGLAPLRMRRRPRDLASQQAAASVGQMILVERYAAEFARHDLQVGQVLLTADDLVRRAHYRNALRTLDRLLGLGVVPIINENDAVATDEIRFGDNDRLAAMVSHLVSADALVLLSDVDALYSSDPRRAGASRISMVAAGEPLPSVHSGRPGGAGLGTGGMASKIDAARIAASQGVTVVLAAAPDAAAALSGQPVGTIFSPTGRRTAARLFWLRHAAEPCGELLLDVGAVNAVVDRRMSLLPAGITAVRGDFAAGEPVDLVGVDGLALARGLVAYDAAELPALLGHSTRELEPEFRREVIHRDDIVLL